MYIVLSIIWNLNSSIIFCLIRGMSCINYYLLKRILDITCGNVLITLLCLSQIIIWSGRIFCTECYLCSLYLLGVCVGVCLPTGVCMYISAYCIVYTFAGLFTKLISIFVPKFMLLSLSAFVRFVFKKTACLLAYVTTMQYKCVLHGCIARMYSWASLTFTAEAENSPVCDRQHGIGKPTLDWQVALSASSK